MQTVDIEQSARRPFKLYTGLIVDHILVRMSLNRYIFIISLKTIKPEKFLT